jgi:threonine synthase
MERLAAEGKYTLPRDISAALRAEFDAFYKSDADGKSCIRKVYNETGYVLDPHTAVAAAGVYGNSLYSGCVVVSTAHPGKFPDAVSEALGGGGLSKYISIPKALTDVKEKPRRFNNSVAPDAIEDFVRSWLG